MTESELNALLTPLGFDYITDNEWSMWVWFSPVDGGVEGALARVGLSASEGDVWAEIADAYGDIRWQISIPLPTTGEDVLQRIAGPFGCFDGG